MKWLKRKYVVHGWFLAGVLVILLLLFILTVCFVSGNLVFEKKIKNSSASNLILSDSVKDYLMMHYNEDKEYGVCLDGYLSSDGIHLDTIGKSFLGDEESVLMDCSHELADLHSHPRSLFGMMDVCVPSQADVESWIVENKQGVSVFIIQCDYNTLRVFDSEDFVEGFKYELS